MPVPRYEQDNIGCGEHRPEQWLRKHKDSCPFRQLEKVEDHVKQASMAMGVAMMRKMKIRMMPMAA